MSRIARHAGKTDDIVAAPRTDRILTSIVDSGEFSRKCSEQVFDWSETCDIAVLEAILFGKHLEAE